MLQFQAVAVGLGIDAGLFPKCHPPLFGKTRLQQRLAQGVAAFRLLHVVEELLIQAGAQCQRAKLGDRGDVFYGCRGDLFSRQRDKVPERFIVEPGEGEGDAAGLPERDYAPPVEVEQLIEFDQVFGDGDER